MTRHVYESPTPPAHDAAKADGTIWKDTSAKDPRYFKRQHGTWVLLPSDVMAAAVGAMLDDDLPLGDAIDAAIAAEAAALGEQMGSFRAWAMRLRDADVLDKEAVDFAVAQIVRAKDRVARAKAQKAEIAAACESIVRDAAEREALILGVIGRERLSAYVLTNPNKGKKSLVTPEGTVKVSHRASSPELEDEGALRDWLTINGLTEYLEPQPAKIKWGELKKLIPSEALGGVIPDGVTLSDACDTLGFSGGATNDE